ncbi:ferritin heavy chain B-like [Hypanus sabinus]|uniref:ferritin heavy chain B-like n=1 Tax=Hypanus sabinus TaxID=79690 RepID=UPI0028C4840E|nr:ferritin heavy chain B-like [Hypanus sabinus]
MGSQVCQNYHIECEVAVNNQINMEIHSSYVYRSMSLYFDQDDVALHHFADFFRKQSNEKWKHAKKLLAFQNLRGGQILMEDVKKPEQSDWINGRHAMHRALQMEKDVNQSLLDLHKLAIQHGDPQLCSFLTRHLLHEQMMMMKRLGDHITNLRRLGANENGRGEYLFDKLSLGSEQVQT